jgi:hypothetical protein
VLTHPKSISPSQSGLRATDDIFCQQQPLVLGFEEERHSGASDEEGGCYICNSADDKAQSSSIYPSVIDLNMECGSIADAIDPLLEDLFASDLDPMQSGDDQFLQNALHDVEPHDSYSSDFSPALESHLEHVDIFAAKVHILESLLSGLGSKQSVHFTPSCTEAYRTLDRNLRQP